MFKLKLYSNVIKIQQTTQTKLLGTSQKSCTKRNRMFYDYPGRVSGYVFKGALSQTYRPKCFKRRRDFLSSPVRSRRRKLVWTRFPFNTNISGSFKSDIFFLFSKGILSKIYASRRMICLWNYKFDWKCSYFNNR